MAETVNGKTITDVSSKKEVLLWLSKREEFSKDIMDLLRVVPLERGDETPKQYFLRQHVLYVLNKGFDEYVTKRIKK